MTPKDINRLYRELQEMKEMMIKLSEICHSTKREVKRINGTVAGVLERTSSLEIDAARHKGENTHRQRIVTRFLFPLFSGIIGAVIMYLLKMG